MVRQLTAIMFADMVGYTALMQENEVRAKDDLDRARRVMVQRVDEHQGQILQYYGDGALGTFQSAIGAVEAAIAIQADLKGPPQIPMRIGLHTGDIIHDEEGVFGDGVNLASRVQGLSIPGGILVSEKVFDEIKNQTRIETRSMGSFALKNVKRPMELWAVTNPGIEVPDPKRMGSRPSQSRNSVAVLPFLNMSPDPENEFFSDGITEELINALTRINGLQVTARTSSFAFKGREQDVRTIASELGVATVLEGSVRKAGDRVRITAQLINAEDGYHLFSKNYDRELLDLFQTQDEIAETIANELEDRFRPGPPTAESDEGLGPSAVTDSGAEAEPVPGVLPETHPGGAPPRPSETRGKHGSHFHDAEAYTQFLKGVHRFNYWTPEDARAAIRHFQRSLELDPSCALPHSGLANAYTFLAATGQMPGEVAYSRAKEAAQRGLDLEEGAGEAHAAMATVLFFHDWDFKGAYKHFQKALTLTPGSAHLRRLYAMYLNATGDSEAALDELEWALEMDPLSSPIRSALGEALMKGGRYQEAADQFRRVLEIDPEFRAAREMLGWAHMWTGRPREALHEWEEINRRTEDPFKVIPHRIWALVALGRTDEADQLLQLLEERRRREPEIALEMDFALAHLGLGQTELTLDYLERAVDRKLGMVVFLKVIPPIQRLADHPRFLKLLEKVGIPENRTDIS
ncbi:MAG: adenylate/guanylate cyclase domain-containing protein [Gemmatimonadetes bacterium]|nr:adenylate/guanylate cyclase domain-containing protein [Gemmatimonadota bacterium]NNM05573.1 adenylate/guanylate cyclase domain-containing protein [Gemmatimonadota bacterium]